MQIYVCEWKVYGEAVSLVSEVRVSFRGPVVTLLLFLDRQLSSGSGKRSGARTFHVVANPVLILVGQYMLLCVLLLLCIEFKHILCSRVERIDYEVCVFLLHQAENQSLTYSIHLFRRKKQRFCVCLSSRQCLLTGKGICVRSKIFKNRWPLST